MLPFHTTRLCYYTIHIVFYSEGNLKTMHEKYRGIHNDTMPSFKLRISLGFVTSCYVIFSLSMVQVMEICNKTNRNL